MTTIALRRKFCGSTTTRPAYVRRARAVEAEFENLIAHCRRQRRGMAADGSHARRLAASFGRRIYRAASVAGRRGSIGDAGKAPGHAGSAVTHPGPINFFTAKAVAVVRELHESIERFNQKWTSYLADLDLTSVNRLREGYNRFYLLEKECAIRSPRLARPGFHVLEPVTPVTLFGLFPLLPLPRISD